MASDGGGDAVLMLQEAAALSSLKPQLDELGVPLYAVVKEDVGTEVQNFQPYFKGEVFLDEKVLLFLPSDEAMYCVVSPDESFGICGESA